MSNLGVYEQVAKRTLDILCVATRQVSNALSDKGKGKIRSSEARVDHVEEEANTLRATKNSSLGKRKLDEHETQNPNHVASSSSSSYPVTYKRRFVVPTVREIEQVVRDIEPVREREPPVRRVPPFRREAPVIRERPAITPEWLVNLMREENGFDEKMIFKKELTRTDLSSHQNRLLIPLNQIVEHDFLNEEEKRIILQQHRKVIDKGVDVIFVGSNGQKCDLNLRRWDMKSSSNYVLVSGWFKAAVNNRLRLGQTIRLWSFHSPHRLFFALAPPGPAPVMALPPAPVLSPVPIRVVAPEAPAPVPAAALIPVNNEELGTYEDSLEDEEERNRIFVNIPKRKRSSLVPVAPTDPESDPLKQLAMCCEEWLLSNRTALSCN